MTANFEIEESIALRFKGKYLDLHNCYDFIGFHYHNGGRQLVLTFMKGDDDCVKADDPQKLVLIHEHVTFVDIKYMNQAYEFPNDDKTLADITFFPSNDRKTNDSVTFNRKPTEGDDIIYMFQSDYFIRIGCDKIELLVEN